MNNPRYTGPLFDTDLAPLHSDEVIWEAKRVWNGRQYDYVLGYRYVPQFEATLELTEIEEMFRIGGSV